MKRLILVSISLLMILSSSIFAQGASYKFSDPEKLSHSSETIEQNGIFSGENLFHL